MNGASEMTNAGPWNPWRAARWGLAIALLATPAVMMRVSDDWHWTPGSFLATGAVIGGVLLLYEFAERLSGSRAYRAGVGMALAISFLTVWTTIVRDDGSSAGFFLVIMAAAVGAFAAWFDAAGMARTMLGVAIMQAMFGLAIATAPVTARVADGPMQALLYNGFFASLWLVAAACFRAAAKSCDN